MYIHMYIYVCIYIGMSSDEAKGKRTGKFPNFENLYQCYTSIETEEAQRVRVCTTDFGKIFAAVFVFIYWLEELP